MNSKCLICNRIKKIKNNKNKFFVKELKTGYVVLGDHQTYRGYTLFLCKPHKSELHQLNDQDKDIFLHEMAIVAEATHNAFKPDKMNYELLGNTDEHMHWHLFPRRKEDQKAHTAIWAVNKENRSKNINDEKLQKLKSKLLVELDKLITNHPPQPLIIQILNTPIIRNTIKLISI